MAKIQDKLFDSGFNLGSPIYVQDGVNGAYVISANQIAWGSNSEFNNDTFGGTTEGLLTAIEEAIDGVVTEVSSAVPSLTFSTWPSNVLKWNEAVKVANINGTDITVKLPANPNTDTDTKVTSVGNHYKENAKEITTEGLYKIKTDAAGHIISATQVNLSNYASKSEYNALLQEFNELKSFIGWNVTESTTKA